MQFIKPCYRRQAIMVIDSNGERWFFVSKLENTTDRQADFKRYIYLLFNRFRIFCANRVTFV